MRAIVTATVVALLASACASEWKIQGGPRECIRMCQGWDLEFAGMVGVGNQDRTGPGATACVCHAKGSVVSGGEPGAAGSLAGPITAAEAVAAAQAAQQQQQQQQAAGRH